MAERLDETNGVLELRGMEDADDSILERAGVVDRDRVTVGGIVDTRNATKPVSTTVTVTGTTFEGLGGGEKKKREEEKERGEKGRGRGEG